MTGTHSDCRQARNRPARLGIIPVLDKESKRNLVGEYLALVTSGTNLPIRMLKRRTALEKFSRKHQINYLNPDYGRRLCSQVVAAL